MNDGIRLSSPAGVSIGTASPLDGARVSFTSRSAPKEQAAIAC